MIINTQAMTVTLDNGIECPAESMTLYHSPGTRRNVIAGTVSVGLMGFNTFIFPDCHLLDDGTYEPALLPGMRDLPYFALTSPLCTSTGDAFRQLLDHAGIKREELHLVERFYP
jgi:hypothetical protein